MIVLESIKMSKLRLRGHTTGKCLRGHTAGKWRKKVKSRSFNRNYKLFSELLFWSSNAG